MAISSLNRAQAFGTGCDLWIVPDQDNFSFFNKLDWYLNFQLTKSHLHQSQSLSPQLKFITNENDLPAFGAEIDKSAPLLIAAEMGLPTKRVVEVSANANADKWVALVHKIWLDLDRPALRVFLPSEINLEQFKNYWPGSKSENITVVPSL